MFASIGFVTFGPVGFVIGSVLDFFLSPNKFAEISKQRKEYHEKHFISFSKYDFKKYEEYKKKTIQFTKELLSKPCDGKIDSRDTLLHVLAGFSKLQGKECLFTNDKSNTNSKFITTIGKNDNQNCVLVLNNLDDVSETEMKSDEKELQKQLLSIKQDLVNNKKNDVIEKLKAKLGKAHGVNPKYIRINDIYYGSAHLDYSIITNFEKKGNMSQALKDQFREYKDLKLHPLFFEESFNIDDFDERGNKVFNGGSTFQVGPKNHKQKYTQPSGWTRYGLKVLDGRYGNNHKWLDPFQDPGNWYRAFHGTSAAFGKKIMDGNGGQQAHFIAGTAQVHCNDTNKNPLSGSGPVGVGVYCSPVPTTGEFYCKNNVTINTRYGPKTYKFMFQVCVDPNKIKFTGRDDHWVAPQNQDAIRPYGILLKEV